MPPIPGQFRSLVTATGPPAYYGGSIQLEDVANLTIAYDYAQGPVTGETTGSCPVASGSLYLLEDPGKNQQTAVSGTGATFKVWKVNYDPGSSSPPVLVIDVAAGSPPTEAYRLVDGSTLRLGLWGMTWASCHHADHKLPHMAWLALQPAGGSLVGRGTWSSCTANAGGWIENETTTIEVTHVPTS